MWVDVNAPCEFKPSCIFIAAEENKLEILELLLTNCRCNLELQDEKGNTILHKTIIEENECAESIIELLIKAGASLDVPNNEGKTVTDTLFGKPKLQDFVMRLVKERKN